MDRTSRILRELKLIVEKKEVSPELTEKIKRLIVGVECRKINLMDYRRLDSIEKYGIDIVNAVLVAVRRQKDRRIYREESY